MVKTCKKREIVIENKKQHKKKQKKHRSHKLFVLSHNNANSTIIDINANKKKQTISMPIYQCIQ